MSAMRVQYVQCIFLHYCARFILSPLYQPGNIFMRQLSRFSTTLQRKTQQRQRSTSLATAAMVNNQPCADRPEEATPMTNVPRPSFCSEINHHEADERERDVRYTKVSILMVFVFFICHAPRLVTNTVEMLIDNANIPMVRPWFILEICKGVYSNVNGRMVPWGQICVLFSDKLSRVTHRRLGINNDSLRYSKHENALNCLHFRRTSQLDR